MGFALQLKPADALDPTDNSSSVCGPLLVRPRPSAPDPKATVKRSFQSGEECFPHVAVNSLRSLGRSSSSKSAEIHRSGHSVHSAINSSPPRRVFPVPRSCRIVLIIVPTRCFEAAITQSRARRQPVYFTFVATALPGKVQATGPIFSSGRPGPPGFVPWRMSWDRSELTFGLVVK